MDLSGTTAAWIAIAAAIVALAAVGIAVAAWLKLRRVRSSQLVLLGGGKSDLVDFAVSLQGRIDDLHRAVDEVAGALSRVDRRIDDCVSKTSILRYDAYDDKAGQSSATFALLNASRPGVVVSAIQGRDYARIYMKELDRGRPSVALSPEELEAVERAMAHGRRSCGSSLSRSHSSPARPPISSSGRTRTRRRAGPTPSSCSPAG